MSARRSTIERNRWTVLAIVSVAELLGMSPWFTASAVSSRLAEIWSLAPGETSWLTTTVLLGFVAGTATAALLNLADVIPVRVYFAGSAMLAAGVNAVVAVAPSAGIAFVCRFLTGFFLAGVYPPAMKMVATWFRSSRGIAIGTVVAALTIGKASPFLVQGLEGIDYQRVILLASAAAFAGALLVALFYEEGPEPFERRPFSWGLVNTVVRDRQTRLAIGGYLGHMWELYAMWAFITLFFRVYFQTGGVGPEQANMQAGLVGFSAIAIGAFGSILAGKWADRFGRERITIWSMAVSGACSLIFGWLSFLPPWALVSLALVWGFAIVADSAQFSALVTEVAPAHAVGTALTLQTSLGFLLTAFTIWLCAELARQTGWGPAFSVLAAGPVFGIRAMVRLQHARRGPALP